MPFSKAPSDILPVLPQKYRVCLLLGELACGTPELTCITHEQPVYPFFPKDDFHWSP